MDGRWKRLLAGGVLVGLAGCTSLTQSSPFPVPPPPPPANSTNTVYVEEPAEEGVKKTGPVGASTKIVYANMCIEALGKDPNRPAAERERTLTQARELYQEVLTADAKNIDALMGLGEMYRVSGEQDRLTEVVGRMTKLHASDAKVWAWVAVKHAQAKNWNAAADAYTRAVGLDQENRTYRIHLGFTLARAGRYDDGYGWLARTMREAEARYNLAMMMLHNGEVERARIELERCLQADPNFGVATEKLAAMAAGNTPRPDPTLVLPPPTPNGGGFEELAPVQLNHAK